MASDQTPLDVEAIRARLDGIDTHDGVGEFLKHTPTDLRRLLDENARLNAHAENGWDLVETYIKQLETQSAQWGKTIDELEARNATVAALSARLTAKNAELDKVIREAAADKARVEAVRDAITPKNPDWKPLTERHPEYFAPVSPEEAARKKGWRQGVELLTQRIKAALDDPAAAPEMPRPPAEEAPRAYRCPWCTSDRWTSVTVEGRAMAQCVLCEAIHTDLGLTPSPEMTRPAAQERAGDAGTSPAGSGRGTGVAEAPGSAQVSEEDR